ncbi:MAG: hypothetical protein R2851_24025 [Caldilineaceae bacterium]
MTIFIAWPFIRAIFTSMTIRTMARETKFVGLDNYIRLYSDPYYHQAVKATFVFTANAILFKLIFGLIAATLLHPLKRGRNLLTGLVLLPGLFPRWCRRWRGSRSTIRSSAASTQFCWRPD